MNFSALYDDVLADCPRATTDLALNALRHAVRELCDKSLIWTYTTGSQAAVTDQSEYTISLPANTEMVALLGGYFDDAVLEAVSADELDLYYGRWQGLQGAPLYVTHNQPGVAIVIPAPDPVTTEVFRWRVALRPTMSATAFDSSSLFCNDYFEDIATGAKARLFATAGKPYSNLKLAESYGKRWFAAINRARLAAHRSRSRTNQMVKIPRTI